MYAELQVRNLKHSQSLAKEISPTGEDVNVEDRRGSPISRQVARGTDVPARIFLIPFFSLATFVIP